MPITVKFQPRFEGDDPPADLGAWVENKGADANLWRYETQTDAQTFLRFARRVDLLGRVRVLEHTAPIGIRTYLSNVPKYMEQMLRETKGAHNPKLFYVGFDGEFGLRSYKPYARDIYYVVAGADVEPEVFASLMEGLDNYREGEEDSLLSLMSHLPSEVIEHIRDMENHYRAGNG